MENIVVNIPFFTNQENEQWLLDGYRIENRSDVYEALRKLLNNHEDVFIYKIRDNDSKHESEYSDNGDTIVGKLVSIINENGVCKARIQIHDTLYYSHCYEPVIRMNGYCFKDDNNKTITITKIVRLTLSNKK